MSLSQLIFSFADGLGVASSSLVGQGLGMRRPDLSTVYGKIGQRCSMLIGFTLSLLLVIFRRPLYGLFTDDAEVIALGMRLCYFVAAVCMIQTSQVVISGCLRGAGDSALCCGNQPCEHRHVPRGAVVSFVLPARHRRIRRVDRLSCRPMHAACVKLYPVPSRRVDKNRTVKRTA